MNLYFRLTRLLLKYFLFSCFFRKSPPHPVLEPRQASFRAWPFDIDLNRHMNNGRFLSLMDLGRTDLMLSTGLFQAAISKGWLAMAAGISITYRRPVFPFQRFHLQTQLIGWDEKWFYLEQSFLGLNQEVLARAYVRACLRDRGGVIAPAKALEALPPQGLSAATHPPAPEVLAKFL